MLILISPAKTLDYESPLPSELHTLPTLTTHSKELIKKCQTLTPEDISKLMKVSDKIAGLNVARFAQWTESFSFDNARQCIFAFKGDVYTGLEAESLSKDELNYTQNHLRILSGLYGVLKPLDLMQPYRLEMGTKLETDRGSNLYQFWGDIITNELNQVIDKQESDLVINLASNEYFKSVKKTQLKGKLITPVFKDEKNGQFKIISFYAKKARGMMSRFIIQNKVNDIDGLKEFDTAGYYFVEAESTESELVFKRNEAN